MRHVSLLTLAAFGVLALIGCDMPDAETRARETLEKIRSSVPNVEELALKQDADLADIMAAQRYLATLNEYQGEINGVLDSVTVNAIQAFQNSRGLEADGLLTDDTMRRLRAAAGDHAS